MSRNGVGCRNNDGGMAEEKMGAMWVVLEPRGGDEGMWTEGAGKDCC